MSLSETKGYFLILNNVQVGYDTREYQSPILQNAQILSTDFGRLIYNFHFIKF